MKQNRQQINGIDQSERILSPRAKNLGFNEAKSTKSFQNNNDRGRKKVNQEVFEYQQQKGLQSVGQNSSRSPQQKIKEPRQKSARNRFQKRSEQVLSEDSARNPNTGRALLKQDTFPGNYKNFDETGDEMDDIAEKKRPKNSKKPKSQHMTARGSSVAETSDVDIIHNPNSEKDAISNLGGKSDKSGLTSMRRQKTYKEKKISEILGKDYHQKDRINDEPATNYFEAKEEKEMIAKLVMNNFKKDKQPNDHRDWFQYGMKPEEFEPSSLNPATQFKFHDEDGAQNEESKKLCASSRPGEGVKYTISPNNKIYMFFNILVNCLCLISSYYYGYVACFRYNQLHAEDFVITASVFEFIFLCHLLMQFIVEYTPEGSKTPVTNLSKISMNYIHGDFPMDVIPLIPFYVVSMKRNRQYLFNIIKMIRIIKGFDLFDVPRILNFVKEQFNIQILRIIENNPALSEDKDADNNRIEDILMVSYAVKILKLVVVILNITYLTGVLSLLMFEFLLDFKYDTENSEEAIAYYEAEYEDTFINQYGLLYRTPKENMIIALYFAFTSLSTVGFGDYNPKSNIERMVCAFILLFGVAIFSYVMGNFIEILDQFKEFHKDLEDGDNLAKFLGTLKQFNNEKPINIELKKKIEDHFDHRWKNDKLMAFQDDIDASLCDQLPEDVLLRIYSDFLFGDFLEAYEKMFSFRNEDSRDQPSFYTWENQLYRNFMMGLLSVLEPRKEFANIIIYNELDEVNEVIFFNKGDYDVGFEINRERYYVIRFKNSFQANIIGAYGVTFNKRSKFIYRTFTYCEGFSVRKTNWKTLMDDDDHRIISTHLQKQLKKDYEKKLLIRVNQEKQKVMEQWGKRADYEAMLMVVQRNKEQEPQKDTPQDSNSSDSHGEGMEKYHDDLEMMDNQFAEYKDQVDSIIQQYDKLYREHVQLHITHSQTVQELDEIKQYIGSKYPRQKLRIKDQRSSQRQPQSRLDEPMLPNSPEPISLVNKFQIDYNEEPNWMRQIGDGNIQPRHKSPSEFSTKKRRENFMSQQRKSVDINMKSKR